jgi:hypothetical protein
VGQVGAEEPGNRFGGLAGLDNGNPSIVIIYAFEQESQRGEEGFRRSNTER